MTAHGLLIFAHILLMVFWIGADIGVFIAGFFMIDTTLSLDQRRTAIELGLVIDRLPRVCFVGVLPVGAQLAFDLHPALHAAAPLIGLIWAASLIWMAAVLTPMFRKAAAFAPFAHGIERVFQTLGIVAVGGGGVWALTHPGLGVEAWLAGKMAMYGVVCVSVIFLERAFGPTMATFGEILTQGSTPDREQRLTRFLMITYVWVLVIYAAVLIAAFLGTVK